MFLFCIFCTFFRWTLVCFSFFTHTFNCNMALSQFSDPLNTNSMKTWVKAAHLYFIKETRTLQCFVQSLLMSVRGGKSNGIQGRSSHRGVHLSQPTHLSLSEVNRQITQGFKWVNLAEATYKFNHVLFCFYLSGARIDVAQCQQLLCHLQVVGVLSGRQCSEHHWGVACFVHGINLT